MENAQGFTKDDADQYSKIAADYTTQVKWHNRIKKVLYFLFVILICALCVAMIFSLAAVVTHFSVSMFTNWYSILKCKCR